MAEKTRDVAPTEPVPDQKGGIRASITQMAQVCPTLTKILPLDESGTTRAGTEKPSKIKVKFPRPPPTHSNSSPIPSANASYGSLQQTLQSQAPGQNDGITFVTKKVYVDGHWIDMRLGYNRLGQLIPPGTAPLVAAQTPPMHQQPATYPQPQAFRHAQMQQTQWASSASMYTATTTATAYSSNGSMSQASVAASSQTSLGITMGQGSFDMAHQPRKMPPPNGLSEEYYRTDSDFFPANETRAGGAVLFSEPGTYGLQPRHQSLSEDASVIAMMPPLQHTMSAPETATLGNQQSLSSVVQNSTPPPNDVDSGTSAFAAPAHDPICAHCGAFKEASGLCNGCRQ